MTRLALLAIALGACRKPPPPPPDEAKLRGPPRAPLAGPFESLDMAFDPDMSRREVVTAATTGPFEAVALLQLDEADPFCVVAVQVDGHWFHGDRLDCATREVGAFATVEGMSIEDNGKAVVVRYRVDITTADGEERTEYVIHCGLDGGKPACSAPHRG